MFSNRAASVTPAQKQVYLSSVYGRQPYHPQRTTSKAPYLHYQSPVNPKTAAIMAGLKPGCERGTVSSKPFSQDLTLVSEKEKEVAKPRKNKVEAAKPHSNPYGTDKPKYYFQPQVAASYFARDDGKVITPLEGQLVPMAIPLGKPKTDPALRPSIPTQESKYISTEIEGTVIESIMIFSYLIMIDIINLNLIFPLCLYCLNLVSSMNYKYITGIHFVFLRCTCNTVKIHV